MSPTRIFALALTVALAVTACGTDSEPVAAGSVDGPTPVPTEPNEGGFGAPVNEGELDTASATYQVTGSAHVAENGCWYVTLNDSQRLIAFPSGWHSIDATSTALRGPSGDTISTGDDIDGTVRFVHQPDIQPDGKWANYMAFCQPDVPELAVFDQLGNAYDPVAVTPDDQAAAIAAADFTEHWPCGRGWAISTADQRVGIVIYQVDDTQPTPGPVLGLPDPGWYAELIAGKHLFANHCNDAIEEWMPTPQIVGRYPITATVVLEDEAPANTDPPATVRATLSDASVDINGGELHLGDLHLRNDAYNAFAG